MQAAFAAYEKMLSLGLEPDAVTMNLLIEAASIARRLDKVNELYEQMQRLGPSPTSHTFVHLFSAFKTCNGRNSKWIFQAGFSPRSCPL